MTKRKITTWLTLLLMVSILICLGVACSDKTPSDATTKPSATASATATAGGQAGTTEGTTAGTNQPEEGSAQPQQTQAPVEGSDNVVTIPPSWGWGTTESDDPAVDATETKQPDNTAAKTETPKPTETPEATEAGTNGETTPTATPKPATTATPIGTDEEGWIDIWV